MPARTSLISGMAGGGGSVGALSGVVVGAAAVGGGASVGAGGVWVGGLEQAAVIKASASRIYSRRRTIMGYCLIPQVEHEEDAHVPQPGALWVTIRPSEWAKNTEIFREVFSHWHCVQAIGVSASLMVRRASNSVRQSRQ